MPKSFRINDSSKIQILTIQNANRIVWFSVKNKKDNTNPLLITGSSDKTIKIHKYL